MLAVVEDEQRPVPLQRRDQAVGGVGGAERQVGLVGAQPGPLGQAERAEHRERDQPPVRQPRQLDQPGRLGCLAVAIGLAAAVAATAEAAGGLHRQPGLAHAARSGERDQPMPAEQLQDPRELLLPPHEAGERPAQVAPTASPPARHHGVEGMTTAHCSHPRLLSVGPRPVTE